MGFGRAFIARQLPLTERTLEVAVAEPVQPKSEAHVLWEDFTRTRSEELRRELVEFYMPLARMIAAKVFALRADDSVRFEDYLQYGSVGLMEAVDRYDCTRDVPFEAYSVHRIRGSILNGISHETELSAQREFWRTRIPERMDSLIGTFEAQPQRASLQNLIDLTVGLALGLVLDSDEVEPVDETVRANPYAAAELQQMSSVLRSCVERLPARERDIIKRHYFSRVEFQAIAQSAALTKGRVSQLHARALALLREMLAESSAIDRKL